MNITASILYDYTQCPHRVWRDKHGPQDEKIKETNPFVQLLWDKGVQHEERVIKDIGEFTDLQQDQVPSADENCDYCNYRNAVNEVMR